LLALQENVPKVEKQIEEISESIAGQYQNLTLGNMAKFNEFRDQFKDIDERIFFVELYAGINEQVLQLREGKAASDKEKIHIHQQLLYMDEETLFSYNQGGLNFEGVKDFDKWVCKPENISRILPEQKCIVAFRVRRNEKDYGSHIHWFDKFYMKEMDKQTYLLVRNGENLYRILSDADFSPRLFPMENEIGEAQFKKIDVFDRDKEPEIITPESVEFDDHYDKMVEVLRRYQRIVFVVQGLLDRSMVFHPHQPINLYKQEDFDNSIVLVRDEENCLPNLTITIEEYQNRLNSSLKKGDYVAVANVFIHGGNVKRYDRDRCIKFNDEYHTLPLRPRRPYDAKEMPDVVQVCKIAKDKSFVIVEWEADYNTWNRYDGYVERHKTFREKIPMMFVLNASAYTQNDYKLFMCDRALKGKYLTWASLLLPCEKWHINKNK
jgi:hypothetical protein